jgi:tetratricopeptide (TPR) repeat protein
MRKSLALAFLTTVALATNVFGVGQGRITGKVLDAATKKPIPDAVVSLEAVEGMTYQSEHKVKKDGSYAILIINATLRYKFTFKAPGYAPQEEIIKLKLGEPNTKDVLLTKGDAASPAAAGVATVPGGQIKLDPAVTAFNEGAALANAGKTAEALAKFEAAVAAKPDMAAGWSALAKMSLRTKNYARAITAANKLLEIDPDEDSMYPILAEAYAATGDKAKAAEMKKKLPADASDLYNEAARAINSGKDGEAEPLLKQAISADEKFAQAHYELGMLYVRGGKNADARTHLQKYLDLEPNGKDAATAKEMLAYVK